MYLVLVLLVSTTVTVNNKELLCECGYTPTHIIINNGTVRLYCDICYMKEDHGEATPNNG